VNEDVQWKDAADGTPKFSWLRTSTMVWQASTRRDETTTLAPPSSRILAAEAPIPELQATHSTRNSENSFTSCAVAAAQSSSSKSSGVRIFFHWEMSSSLFYVSFFFFLFCVLQKVLRKLL
jgi:hypothetical protein